MKKLFIVALFFSSTLLSVTAQSRIIMQAFYWDYPSGGNWWNTINGKVDSWKAAGITDIWLPPVQKSDSGPYSMGYDPYDYFDFGQYTQKGTTETRGGSYGELTNLITKIHSQSMGVYADIVINHNSGGTSEFNPFTNTNTNTSFIPVSGKFLRSYNDFHPNADCTSDAGTFSTYPDLAHCKAYVQDWLWKRTDSVAQFYKNTLKFDGWRFDFVRGFGGWVVRDWVNAVGGFSVGENWDSNKTVINNWIASTDNKSSAFDFALYYSMDSAFDGNNLNNLKNAGLISINPSKAVTFVTNHDTDIISKKNMAYGYIFTHEGDPTLFYQDYESWLDKNRLNNLIWIYNNKAKGTTSNLFVDQDELIDQRNGTPGLVVYFNNSSGDKYRVVQTKWKNTVIKDYTGRMTYTKTTDANGFVEVGSKGNDYSVWAPN